MSSLYLERYAYPRQMLTQDPSSELGLVVTIPCFNEPDVLSSLQSISQCDLPSCAVETIVIINQPKSAPTEVSKQNRLTFDLATKFAHHYSNDHHKFHVVYVDDLPDKHAGVGLARKIAMDEAVRRFDAISKPDGLIVCFDADATCDSNYLFSIESHFIVNPTSPGCSIYFEHPLDRENTDPIVLYELYLRYYINALRYAGFPYAHHTIGSSMAVRSWAYQKQGGMNKRKAGEDFYFLHRIMPLGNYTDLNTTRVIPSSRSSNRVPFGTGRAMLEWQSGKRDLSTVYHHRIFEDLRDMFSAVDRLAVDTVILPASIDGFLKVEQFTEVLKRLRQHASRQAQFRKNFFHWFDGFKVLKFVHFARDNYYPNENLEQVLRWLDTKMTKFYTPNDLTSSLVRLRQIDRSSEVVKSNQTNS